MFTVIWLSSRGILGVTLSLANVILNTTLLGNVCDCSCTVNSRHYSMRVDADIIQRYGGIFPDNNLGSKRGSSGKSGTNPRWQWQSDSHWPQLVESRRLCLLGVVRDTPTSGFTPLARPVILKPAFGNRTLGGWISNGPSS